MPRRTIEVVDPDPSWPARFASVRDRVTGAFARAGVAGEVVAIEHVGSTAVPDLVAKPIIDVMVGLRAWPAPARLVTALAELGYHHQGEAGIAGRHYFTDGEVGGDRTCQIHAVEHGGRFWRDHLLFRDVLRRDVDARTAYGELKRELAGRHRDDTAAYTDAKGPLIRDVLAKARTERGDTGVHTAVAGFDADPDRYDRARPGYPEPAVAHLVHQLGIAPGATVVDLGAGTGKLTAPLTQTGATVIAVEPAPAMCRYLATRLADVDVRRGTAEELDLPMGSVDALVAGQAFHWFDAWAALSEAYRALRPGGGMGLVWNTRDESVAWVAGWSALVGRLGSKVPRARERSWEDALDHTELFVRQSVRSFANHLRVAREAVVERVASTSVVAALDDVERKEVLTEFRAVLDVDPTTRGRDQIEIPYRTEVTVLARTP